MQELASACTSPRPAVPQYSNWENYFGVILRDAGEVVIFDGDTRREVVRLNTGFAVHILGSSAEGVTSTP